MVAQQKFHLHRVGLAAAEGKLTLEDPVLKYFPAEAPAEPGENLKAMRVRDLLSMSGGHDVEPKFDLAAGARVRAFLAHPVPHRPGAWFRYNTPSTYMLSAIATKATGQTVLDYLKPRLFEPLGIENPTWGATPEGYTLSGYGLPIRTEHIAKFGLLYLQKGKWQGKPLLPEKCVEEATAKQVDNCKAPSAKTPSWQQGYGFQFWRSQHNAYRGDGRDGQICLVIPEHNAVVAITAQTSQMQTEFDLVWQILCPPSFPNRYRRTLPSVVRHASPRRVGRTLHAPHLLVVLACASFKSRGDQRSGVLAGRLRGSQPTLGHPRGATFF